MFVIEKGKPIPEETRGRPLKYPFGDMEVGDSFTAAVPASIVRSIRAGAHAYGTRHRRKYTTKVEGDRITVWRVS